MFLEVRNLTKDFGGIRALRDVNFNLEKGELLGIIGPNGSGKTTLFNVIAGIFPPTGGEVMFQGSNIAGLRPYLIARNGISRTYQTTTIFSKLTVLDNAMIKGVGQDDF